MTVAGHAKDPFCSTCHGKCIMEYRVNCVCGKPMLVTAASAGATLPCPCGRSLTIPSLSALRASTGLAPYDPSPELVLEHLAATGELPPDMHCIGCGTLTEEILPVFVECEKAYREGGFSWGVLLLSMLFLPIKIFHWKAEVEFGRDKIFRLPLPVCPACRDSFRGKRALWEGLSQVAVYGRLLEKFPDAKVYRGGW